jgi:DNA-binding SARP family transcriptional activator
VDEEQSMTGEQANKPEILNEREPLLRVFLLGALRLEWLVASSGQEDAWQHRTSARSLFLLLVCAPGRQATRSQLAGMLWPEKEEALALESLRAAIKVLRQVLRTAHGRMLVEAVPHSDLLRLADQSQVWVDVDAFEALVQQASQATEIRQALQLWERARALMQGEFLEGEQDREWSLCRWIKLRRKGWHAARRRMIYYLAKAYLQTEQPIQAEEALIGHVTSFPADQDALYLLMKLLIEEERFEEAHRHYEDGKQVLSALGKSPAKHLQALDKHVSTLDITARMQSPPMSVSTMLALPISGTASEHWAERVIPDCATQFGIALAEMITRIQQWYGMALFCHDLQAQLDYHIKRLDALKSHYDREAYTLSRRSFLITLAALPTAALTARQQAYKQILALEELLPQCAASIIACWHLSGGSHLEAIAPILDSYLPSLIAICQHVPSHREVAADLVAQCYFLKTILAWHVEGLVLAETYCQQAMRYSEIANNANLQLTALNQQALIAYYARQFPKALTKSEEASVMLEQTSQEPLFPIVSGRVFMYLAAIQAQQGRGEAEQTLEQAQKAFALQAASSEPVPLYADCGNAPLALWDGLTHYHLSLNNKGHAQKALSSLRTFGQLQPALPIPERFRLECLTNRILAATRSNEMEEAIDCFEAGRQGATTLGSKQRIAEVDYAYQQMLKRWPHEERVRQLSGTRNERN